MISGNYTKDLFTKALVMNFNEKKGEKVPKKSIPILRELE